jgi:shikimate kinase
MVRKLRGDRVDGGQQAADAAAMPGEAKLMDRTSNPSRAFRPMVIATATICSTLMRLLEMVSRGSVFAGVTGWGPSIAFI